FPLRRVPRGRKLAGTTIPPCCVHREPCFMKPKKSSSSAKAVASPRPRRAATNSTAGAQSARTSRPTTVRSTVVRKRKPPTPSTAEPVRTPRKPTLKIPAILLEGDKPASAPLSGPGQRYALGPTPPVERLEAEGTLPEAYGTRELLLAARDPHW